MTALARFRSSPILLCACRVARTRGDATLMHTALEELRRRDPEQHAALAAHPGAFLRAANRDEPLDADGATAELRTLWAFAESARKIACVQHAAVQHALDEAAAARAARDAALASERAIAARLEAAQRALRQAQRPRDDSVAAQPRTPADAASTQPAAMQAAAGAPGGHDAASGPPPGVPRYKGVGWDKLQQRWHVQYTSRSSNLKNVSVGYFCIGQEVAAARAFDAAVRADGGTVVNFPRAGTAETQAVFQPKHKTTHARAPQVRGMPASAEAASRGPPGGAASRAAVPAGGGSAVLLGIGERDRKRPRVAESSAGAAPATTGAAPAAGAVRSADCGAPASNTRPAGAPRLKGVSWHAKLGRWQVSRRDPTAAVMRHIGFFPRGQELAAARAYDDAVRAAGGMVVNFPRPDTAETKAEPGQRGRLLPKSGIQGVHMYRGRFEARAKVGGRVHYVGSFDTAEEAARVRRRFQRDAGEPLEQPSAPDAAGDFSDGDDDHAGDAAGGVHEMDEDDAAWLE